MPVPFLLTPAQMRRIRPHFPLSHGIPRVDDRRVLSGIIFVIEGGPALARCPARLRPHKTLYNRFVRWSRMGVFSQIFAALAGDVRICPNSNNGRACHAAQTEHAPGVNAATMI